VPREHDRSVADVKLQYTPQLSQANVDSIRSNRPVYYIFDKEYRELYLFCDCDLGESDSTAGRQKTCDKSCMPVLAQEACLRMKVATIEIFANEHLRLRSERTPYNKVVCVAAVQNLYHMIRIFAIA
jgi:hypothetical protein